MKEFSLSANIESSVFDASQYIVTPNAQRAVQGIIDDFRSGIHSFTIIGSYGTGKSSFLLALEADLTKKSKQHVLVNPQNLTSKEITFVEPIEQILYLASRQVQHDGQAVGDNADKLFSLAKEMRFVSDTMSDTTVRSLYPLDIFSAYSVTSAITRYGQNERSLFTFLSSKGVNSLLDFVPHANTTFNLQHLYDYIVYNFLSILNKTITK